MKVICSIVFVTTKYRNNIMPQAVPNEKGDKGQEGKLQMAEYIL
jgi:hypothetical protein